MDNVTHSLAGWALGRAGLARTTPGATVALVVASNLPDIDTLAALGGSAAYLDHHRDLTHSVLGVPVLALALAVALWRLVPGARFGPLFALSGLGGGLHVVMDLWTSYGTRALAPLTREWFAWDLVFIADPWILLALAAGIGLCRWPAFQLRAPRAALAIVTAYVLGRALAHAEARNVAARAIAEPVYRVAALPHPLDPRQWRVLVDSGAAYHVGEVVLGGPAPVFTRYSKTPETPLVARVRESSAIAAIFLDFSRWPWLEVEAAPGGTAIVWRDLRFDHPRRRSFVTRVVVDGAGHIVSESFRF